MEGQHLALLIILGPLLLGIRPIQRAVFHERMAVADLAGAACDPREWRA